MNAKIVWLAALAVATASGCGSKKNDGPPDAGASTKAAEPSPLGFRLRDADPEKSAPRSVVRGEALTAPETETLLARLPKLATSDGDVKSFALRESSAPPPRPGRTITAPFPPPSAAAPVAEVKTNGLTVLRKQPVGDVAIAPNVSITFSAPMVALSTVSSLDAQLVKTPIAKLTPQPKGAWRWVGTETLVFQPESRGLPKATEYVVEVPAGTKGVAGAPLGQAERFVFKTPPPVLVGSLPSGSDQVREPLMFAEFDQAIDPARVVAKTEVRADGLDFGARLATPDEIAKSDDVKERLDRAAKRGKSRAFAFKPKKPLPAASAVRVVFGAGTPSAEGPLLTKAEQSFEYSVHAPISATIQCSWPQHCYPDSALVVELSSRLDLDAFKREQVTVTPVPEDLEVTPRDRTVALTGKWKIGTKYTVTAKKGLRDIHGQTLAEDANNALTIEPFEPNLYREHQPLTMADPHAPPRASIFSRNEPPVRVRLYRVRPEHWQPYMKWREAWDGDGQVGTPPGDLVSDKEVALDRRDDRTTESFIDLAPVLEGGRGHVLVIAESKRSFKQRWEKAWSRQWVQATRIGVTYQSPSTSNVVLLATDLASMAPMPNVGFALLPGEGSGTTGANGLAQLALPTRHVAYRVLVARSGNDSAFVPFTDAGSDPRGDTLSFYGVSDRGVYKPGEKVTIKGLFRMVGATKPGAVSIPTALVGKKLPYAITDARGTDIGKGATTVDDAGGVHFDFKIPDRANLGAAQVMIDTSAYSGVQFEIQEFRRPEFEVNANVEGGPHVVGGFAVATARASYYAGGGLSAADTTWNVSREDASFAPPDRKDYRFARSKSGIFSFFFYDPDEKKEKTSAEWKGRTGADGAHRLHIDFDGTKEPYPFTLNARAQITDVNRQAWTANTSLLVHPANVYAGLKLEKSFVRAGDPIELDVVAVDLNGKFVPGRKVRLRAVRDEYAYEKGKWAHREVDETTCEAVTLAGPAPKACSLATKKPGQHVVYADVEDEKGRRSRTRIELWVIGKLTDVDRGLREDSIELTPAKSTYKPGETAEVLVRASFAPAEGFLYVTGGVERRTIRVRIEERTQTISVPIGADDVTDLQLSMSLAGNAPRRNAKGEIEAKLGVRPAYAAGATTLSIPTEGKRLVVALKTPERNVAPGASTVVSADVKDASGAPAESELAVWVVDEAVLALSAYKLADPRAAFYQPLSEYVQRRDSRAYVTLAPDEIARNANRQQAPGGGMDGFGAGGLGLSGIGEGGGGRGEGIGLGNIGTLGHGGPPEPAPPSPSASAAPRAARAAALKEAADFGMIGLVSTTDATGLARGGTATMPIALRTKFDALALFAGRVKTDANGHAEMPVKLPESTTRFRLLSIAWDARQRFGTGEGNVTTRLPLLVRPSAPRFLNYGDAFELPVVLQNQTDAKMRVAIAARTANATLDEALGRSVEVPANDRVEVRLPAHAKQPGKARFQIAAATGSFADAAEVELPVWTPGTTEAFATYGVIDEGAEKQALAIPDDVEKGFGGLELSTSSTALFALSDAVLYLTRYPFDCNEQIASRTLAIAALRDMLSSFGTPNMPSAVELRASVERDLAQLKKRQDPSSGGFGFWAGEPWPWLTAHVGLALATAQSKGFAVDASVVQRTIRYLKDIDRHLPPDRYAPDTRRVIKSFALFVLKRLGQPDGVAAKLVIDDAGGIDKLSLEALGWLLPTLHESNAPLAADIRKHFGNRVTETAGAAHFVSRYGEGDWLVLGSEHRSDAVVLGALIETDPKSDLLPKVVSGLLGARKRGRWSTTQENAFVLLALDAYFQRFEKVAPDFVARVWLGDKTASEHRFKGFNVDRVESVVPMPELMKLGGSDLVVEKSGAAGRLYYRLGLKYAPSSLVLPPTERGFAVTRHYEGALDPNDVRRDDKGIWHVKAGAPVRVKLTLAATAERHHVALVDPLPAGFEPVNSALAGSPIVPGDDPEVSRWSWTVPWRRTWFEHENLRDERVEAFASLLPAGVYEYVYTARATTPGTFVVPPSKAEEMYSPEVFGRAAGEKVIVE